MGNTSNAILVVLSINLFMGMIALGIMSVDPSSDLLLSNKLFGTSLDGTDNQVTRSINNASGIYTYDMNTSVFDTLGSADSSTLSTSTSIFPDWIRSGWKYMMNAGRSYINIVGAPYTIASGLGLDSDLSALIGSFFGIFLTFIFLNWMLGRDS
jgi:hypothetical protein